MIVSIMQPAYLPWLGFFDRIAASDIFILLDHVEIDRNSKTKFANRNRVRTAQGWSWLTVPIRSKGKHGELRLNEIEVNNETNWPGKHWRAIELNYRRAPYFADYAAPFRTLLETRWTHLADLNAAGLKIFMEALTLNKTVLSSSEMDCRETKDKLILELCRKVGATTYLSGPFGRDYLNPVDFEAAGVELLIHDYDHPQYNQSFDGFEPYMSTLDLLFNHGTGSLQILRSPHSLVKPERKAAETAAAAAERSVS
ncbi:WbqC family protein [Pelagibius sp.]|uniref:WbqC family protein n=1 Tax=Pelagibius sp. TaxID=1931238 RepID=UPI003B503C0B